MPATSRVFVNLLPKTEFESSLWGKILKWSLTTGRYLIILTEMVVIVAFLSRFKLDKDLADLSDSISGKKAILDASKTAEVEFRAVQARLVSANQILSAQVAPSLILDHITSLVPEGMKISNLSINRHEVTISAQAPETAFKNFMDRLSQDSKFTKTSLANLLYDPAVGVKFSVKTTYK